MSTPDAKRIYLLDTNVLFEFSKWMPIPLNGTFWSALEKSLKSGEWILLDAVVDEIKYDKELAKWCHARKKMDW